MRDVIKKLTPEQALEVLMRLSHHRGAIRDTVLAEARNVLSEIDLDETAAEVFFALDSIDVHDCWDRAGSSGDSYTSPDDAALELIEAQLQPFFDQTKRYHELGLLEEEDTYCRGVILGIYRYEHESKSEFRQWAVDIPIECAGALLAQWRERGRDAVSAAAMDAFIRDRCPHWTRDFLRTGGPT
ncbi:MAG: hypothetical protein WCA12_19515 [Burkholderiales bacterium]